MDEITAKPWHLFTSEDMLKGNRPKKPRKERRIRNHKNKENFPNIDNVAPSSSPISPQSILINTPVSYDSSTGFSSVQSKSSRSIFTKAPFSDITNQSTTTVRMPRRRKLQSCLGVDDSQRHNFEDMLDETVLHNVNVEYCHEQLESSIIEDDRIHDGSDDSNDEFCVEDPWGEDFDHDTTTVIPPVGGRRSLRSVVPDEYCTLGPPTAICRYCNARMWKEERVNKNVTKGTPIFSICCKKGEVKLPAALPTPPYLQQIYNDPEKCLAFMRNIRIYNSMFCFTSAGGNVDHSINNGRGPYIYRLNGQNHHVFGSLIPDDGDTPKFCQLYIYDTANEVNNRLRWVNVSEQSEVDAEVVAGLLQMLDETNELCKEFRMARDRFENNDLVDLKVELKVCRSQSGRENHISASDDVAGVMVGSTDNTTCDRDIIIEPKMGRLRRVSYVHPKFMSLQYPILFPNGEDGYHDKIPVTSADPHAPKDSDMISMKSYYSYKFQVRENEGMTPRLGGRLYQQYIVDAFSSIEQTRLWWFRINQTVLRNELYSHICDSIQSGDSSTANVGKGVILPSGFVGSRRYMQQNFQDALAVCRHVGHPDIFLTMTTNPLWDEIQRMMEYLPGCHYSNCPDIISRVFRLKLDQLTDDIKKKSYFGKCIGIMFVVEFQKRGLPHVHMLIWLDAASKVYLKKNVDKFVSAEIPDPIEDPIGYAAVKMFMMHGPCGLQNLKSPCMKGFKCTRFFPKKFDHAYPGFSSYRYCPRTVFDESGFPIYRRRRQNVTIKKGNAELDNQWVVPYNRDLLVKYQCHMNIEICCHARSIKYLFKYCLKGHDTATVQITGKRRRTPQQREDEPIDEINAYFDGRYVCGAEAAYRIFGFPIHHRSLSVERLPFHLPGQKNCTFRADGSLREVADKEKERLSKLEAFFLLNQTDTNATQFTYDEIPQHYVWNDTARRWKKRQRGFQIGRLSYCHHSSGEVWFLRMLLTKVKGATSFEDLRTVNGVCCTTFRDACKEYGLLDDDKEWHEVIKQCAAGGLPPQIRQLFVHIIVNCKVTDMGHLWECHWGSMIDDILLKRRNKTQDQNLVLNEIQLQYYALAEIDDLLRSIGKSLKNFLQLPQPPSSYLNHGLNNLIIEETSYNLGEMQEQYQSLLSNCNDEQLDVYNKIMESIEIGKGGFYFVYGSGGCGKTYLWRTLICKLRSQGDIVLPVASSGIAATLLPGGRTAHSRFKIPIVLDDISLCCISHNSDIAALLRATKLIIWDEAPMQHRYAFECLDRTLRDLMKSVDATRSTLPFGGITVLLGGDFRQILPVITFGERGDIVSASITRSRLWSTCHIFLLSRNMRLNKGQTLTEKQDLAAFAQWVLDIGDGKVSPPVEEFPHCGEDDIIIPHRFCDVKSENTVDNMINETYPDFTNRCKDPKYLSERAILTPTNQTVGHLNSLIVEKLPGESFSYLSIDTAEDFGGTDDDLHNAFPTEYLNSINISGMPPHELKLKVGVVVMLMRNLNQTLGLCNGTRMIVTKCLKFCVECEVICGAFVGTRHFIPRMELAPSETRMPFKLVRKQMPLQICYAMTINKAQGQSLETVGLYLPKSCFTHGQFYVAISRVTSPAGLKIFVDDDDGMPTNKTQNVVYQEIFYNLPKP